MRAPAAVKRLRKRAGHFHHGDLREAALEMTEHEVETNGHKDVSLERIAARLGVTRPALYRHFSDKGALLAEVAQRGYSRFESSVSAAFLERTDAWDAVEALSIAYVEFARTNPGWFRLQFSMPVPVPDLTRAPPRYAEPLKLALARELSPDEAPHAYRAVWALAHGVATLVVEGVMAVENYPAALAVQVRALAAYARRPDRTV